MLFIQSAHRLYKIYTGGYISHRRKRRGTGGREVEKATPCRLNSPRFVGQTWGSFMPQRIPQDVRQQVLQLLQKGLRYRAIARILHISCSTVKRWQGQFDHGIMDWTQAHRPAVTSEIAQSIVQRYLEVGSFLQVAKEFGVSDRSVHRYYMNILNAGQPFLPKGRKPCRQKTGEPMPQQKPQRARAASSRKARTTASYEKEIRELNILVESLLVSMEQNLEGVKKKSLIRQLLLLHREGRLVNGLAGHTEWHGAQTTTERLAVLLNECRRMINSQVESEISKKDINTDTESSEFKQP